MNEGKEVTDRSCEQHVEKKSLNFTIFALIGGQSTIEEAHREVTWHEMLTLIGYLARQLSGSRPMLLCRFATFCSIAANQSKVSSMVRSHSMPSIVGAA